MTIVRASGSTPQRTGAKMLVFADGRTVGTIGGGCYENDALGKAREAIATGKPALVKYDLNDDFVAGVGPHLRRADGGLHRSDRARRRASTSIGAGHVGWHLGRIAADAGFRLHVVDDREKFANPERFPAAETIEVDDLAGLAPSRRAAADRLRRRRHARPHPRLRGGPRPRRPRPPLPRPDRQPRQGRAHLRRARSEGMPLECLARVHAPIGLDIGAITPAEIAISILAELIAIRHGKDVSARLDEVDPTASTDTRPGLVISVHR